jgi:DNA-binding SARP family transcriptional activator
MSVKVVAPALPAHRGRPRRKLGDLSLDLRLLSDFELRSSAGAVWLTLPAQRLLAFLAVQNRPVPRAYAAGVLWIDSSDQHASGSLRSALWHLRRTGYSLLEITGRKLRLAPVVRVDVHRALDWAQAILDGDEDLGLADIRSDQLSGELLPDWYEDWVLIERERCRELRMQALECLCHRQIVAGRFGQAVEVGLAAIKAEPLRESAHRHLIAAQLAQGNQAQALRHYFLFRQLLRDELNLEPSRQMDDLVRGLTGVERALSRSAHRLRRDVALRL